MNQYTGSGFDEFLKDDEIYDEVTVRTHKRLLALQLTDAMETSHITRQKLAAKLQTSGSQLDRLLDPDDTSVTLDALERLALTVGGKPRIELA